MHRVRVRHRRLPAFDATAAFWRGWVRRSRYGGRWREMVHRSALTLKLLTYAPSGAIVAAPTTSLPEQLGGARNWDYRYTWMRDAAFSVYALLRLGFTEEAGAFMAWLQERVRHGAGRESGPLQIMYGIDGREDLPEAELSHLEGYRGSRPVRIGNGAATQLQLDVYGELMDSLYLCNKHGLPVYQDGWAEVTRTLEWLMHPTRLAEVGDHVVAHTVGIPRGGVEQALHPVRRRVPGHLGQRPPVLPGQRRQQPTHIRPRTPPRLRTEEPARHQPEQPVQATGPRLEILRRLPKIEAYRKIT